MDLNILVLQRSALALFSLMERSLTRYCQLRFVSVFTPTYLTLSVRYSLLPHNFIFKSPLNFFENFSKRCFMKSDALGNSAKLTGKHLCQSLLFNKVAGLKKRLWHRFAKISDNTFLQNTSGQLLLYTRLVQL